MERNIRLLGIGTGIRSLGLALFGPFLALFLYNVLHVPFVEIGIILAIGAAIPVGTTILGGLLTDRFGRRRLFLLTLTGEALFTLLLAYGMSQLSLLIGVAAAYGAGVVSSLGGPALSAYVADHAEGSARTKGFTFWRVGTNAGFAAGVSLGGFLLPYLGFVEVTLLSCGILLTGVAFLATMLHPSPYDLRLAEARARRTDAPPPGGLAENVAGSEGGSQSHPGPPPRSSRRPPMRESLKVVSRDRPFLVFCLAAGLATISLNQWGSGLNLFANTRMGISYTYLGLALALNGVIVVAGQTATTNAVLGRRLTGIGIAGIALYVVSYLAFGVATLLAFFPLGVFFVGTAVLTMGENLVSIPGSTLPSNLAPEGERGFYNGGYSAMTTAGAIGASLLGGAALQYIQNPVLLWIFLSAPCLPAMLLLRASARNMPARADRA